MVHAALLLTAVIWGINSPAIKYLLRTLDPIDVLMLRVGGAAIIFAVILAPMGRRALPATPRDAVALLGLGVLGITVMNLTLAEGQQRIPAALASLVVTTNPIHTALLSAALGYERLTRRTLAGIGLATMGFVVVLLFGTGKGANLSGGHLAGMGIMAIAPFTWAIYTVLSKPFLTRYPPTQVAGLTAIGGAFGALPLLLLDGGIVGRMGNLSATGWGAAVYLSSIGFVLAYILWYRGLRVLSASQTAVYIYLVPVFGIFFAWLLLGETITPWLVLGGAIILAGVVLTNRGRVATPSRPAPATDANAEAATHSSSRTPTTTPIR